MKRTGLKAHVFLDGFDEQRVIAASPGQETEPATWYFIIEQGEGSSLPYKGSVFKSPASGNEQVALVAGDRLFPLDPRRVCKTSCSVSAEEGTVEAGDDCDPGETVLDGNVKVSGSLSKLFRYNEGTGEFDDVTADTVNRFFKIIDDDGDGAYETRHRENGTAFLLICLNSDAKIGQVENWLFVPAIISSMSVSLGNSDAQNQDLSWSKGEGEAVVYRVPKTA